MAGTMVSTQKKPTKKKSMAIIRKLSRFNLKRAKTNDTAELPVSFNSDVGGQERGGEEYMSQPMVASPVEEGIIVLTSAQISTDARNDADLSGRWPPIQKEQSVDSLNQGCNGMDSVVQETEPKKPTKRQPLPLSSSRRQNCRDSVGSSISTASSYSDGGSIPSSQSSFTPADSSLMISPPPVVPGNISPSPNIIDPTIIQSTPFKGKESTEASTITKGKQDPAAAPNADINALQSELPAMDMDNLRTLNSVPSLPQLASIAADIEAPAKETTSSLKLIREKENKISFWRAIRLGKRPVDSKNRRSRHQTPPALPPLSPCLGSFNPRLSQSSLQILSLPGPSQPPASNSEQLEDVGSSEISGVTGKNLRLTKTRKQLKEDRILAEKLQLLEDEELCRRQLELEKLTEVFIRAEQEEERARLEELARIAIDDAAYAAEIERQEKAIEAERRERERIAREEKEQQETMERQKKADAEQLAKSVKSIGVPITVRRVNNLGALIDVSNKELTLGIVQLLKDVKDSFAESLRGMRVRKIEYIINPRLQEQFEKTREKLRECGHNSDEVLLFHGTMQNNIIPYEILRLKLTFRIVTGGFKVGGVEGHPYRHGSSMVILVSVKPDLRESVYTAPRTPISR